MCEPAVRTTARTIGFIAENNGHIRALAKIPALLHVNRETREEALKRYQLCFSEICGGKPVYIDFSIDRLYMYTGETFRSFFVKESNGISNLALHMESKQFLSEARHLLVNCASTSLPKFLPEVGFKNLKVLVMHGEKRGDRAYGFDGDGWTLERQKQIRENYRPKGDTTATDFELVIFDRHYSYRRWTDEFFDNMVRLTHSLHLIIFLTVIDMRDSLINI